MSIAKQGVYWPYKTLLQGAGIALQEDANSIRITNTGSGGGGGGGDMLQSQFATNGAPGVVDKAVLAENLAPGVTVPLAQQANAVPWSGITGVPTSFPSDWSVITSKPNAFPPSAHAPTHAPTGTDPIALAGPTAPGFLATLSGQSTDYVGGDNATHPLSTALAQVAPPTIWSVRLRSFNAIGNPNADVYQRRAGNALTITSSSAWLEDRWVFVTASGVSLTGQRVGAGPFPGGGIILPGTNFTLSRAFLRLTLNGTKTALAATDWLGFEQPVEGPVFRELCNDVHSVSLLVRSSVPNLKFCIGVRDAGGTRSLVNVVSLGAANTLTLVPLPNLTWPQTGGTFNLGDGLVGYYLFITLGTGSNFWGASGTEGTWQTGNFIGSPLQSNFAFGPVGSTFDLCFVQHEPGPVCSTFIDKPYHQNIFECERYFQKNYQIGNLPGGPVGGSYDIGWMASTNVAFATTKWKRRMAKTPSVVLYGASNGAANQVWGQDGNPYQGVVAGQGDTGFMEIVNNANNFPAAGAGNWMVGYYWTADCGM